MSVYIPQSRLIKSTAQQFLFSARLDANLKAFAGHFPDCPVFPGVAQIAMVKAIVDEHFANFKDLDRIEQLRFQGFIFPEQDIFIQIEPQDHSIQFKVTNAMQEPLASGRMVFKTLLTTQQRIQNTVETSHELMH